MKHMNSSLKIFTALVAFLISASVAHADTRCVSRNGDDFVVSGQKFSTYTNGDDNTDPEANTPWATLKFLVRYNFSVKITGRMRFENLIVDLNGEEHTGKLYILPNKDFTAILAPSSGFYVGVQEGKSYTSNAKLVYATNGAQLFWDSERTVGLREALTDRYKELGQEVDYVKSNSLKCFKI